MKSISKNIVENPYLRTESGNVVFLYWMQDVINSENINLDKKLYFHTLIKYPSYWPNDLDIFQYLEQYVIEEIKNNNCYFIFDASTEGFSPLHENWFDIIYLSCEKYNINPLQIIFVSSNLYDEQNIIKYCNVKNKTPINVISIILFEAACTRYENVEYRLKNSIKDTKINYNNKFFSSLSRLNRHHRAVGTFLLCQSDISNHGLISHDRLKEVKYILIDLLSKTSYKKEEIENWIDQLPLVVDYSDFEYNWALNRKFDHIHNQTIFQIVNETLVDNYNNTSLFYSEKTFRPISCFQPFLIYGQVGCNHYIKNLGYKLYDEWFDLRFDYEEDYIKRYQKLLDTVKDQCRFLNSLSRPQQIDWKFKNTEILKHNFVTMNNHKYSYQKIKNLLLNLINQSLEHSK